MLFGALALAASTAVTSCKDYDDDVKNLQEQIDKITSTNPVSTEDMKTAISSAVASLQTQLNAIADKADKTAVAQLEAAVAALQTALNGKADAAQITELQNQITALTETVNASIDQKVGAAKTELQAKIDALQAELEQADADAAVQVAEDLAAAKNELKALIEANGEKIADLQSKIGELEGIKSRIDALEAAHADFAKKADLAGYVTTDALNAYMNSEELKGYIDEQLVDYLTSSEVTEKIGAVQTYVDGVFKTALMADIKATYLSIETYNEDMEALNEKISKFVDSESAAYKKIFTDITTLQNYKTQTLDALVESITKEGGIADKVNDFNNALGDITNLTSELAGCAKTTDLDNYVKSTDLNTNIGTYLTETYGDLNGRLSDIKKQLKALEIDVDGLKSMIQSVMYVPTSAQGDAVYFSSYYVKPTEGDKVLVAANNAVTVKFRVSPVSAAKDFLKNYTTSFDAQVISRAANVFTSVGAPEIDEAEGIITFVLATTTEDCHAVCLNIVAKNQTVPPVVTGDEKNNGTDYFTNISSNYFPVIVNSHTITGVTVDSKDNASEIFYDKPLSKVDYKTGASYLVTTTATGNSKIRLTDVNLDNFTTTYRFQQDANKKPVDGEGKFQIVDGVLSLKEYVDAANGKLATVEAVVAIKGVTTGYTNVTTFASVTAKASSKPTVTYDLEAAGQLKYNGAADQIIAEENFPIAKIVSGASINEAAYKAIPAANFTAEAAANSGVKFVVDHANGNALTVVVPKGTVAGTYAPKLIVQASDVKTFEVTTSVTVAYDAAIALVIDTKLVPNSALDLMQVLMQNRPMLVSLGICLLFILTTLRSRLMPRK